MENDRGMFFGMQCIRNCLWTVWPQYNKAKDQATAKDTGL